MITTVALFGLIGILRGDPTGLSLSGTVTDRNGSPLSDVRVQIATAAPRIGEGLYCPSCYRDCAKWTTTDKEGNFTIAGLDTKLKFTLMATRPGKKTLQTKFVDPLRGITHLVLEPAPTDLPPERTVHLQIVDKAGRDVPGAIVYPCGAKTEGRRWYGQVDDVDPAASDSAGHVQIVLPKGYQAVDLEVTANGFAGTLLMEQPPGPGPHKVVLPSGTRVEARLVRQGKPVVGARIAVVQMERSAGHHFIKAVGAVSDQQGKVVFEHLPASEEYVIFTMAEGAAQPFVLKTRRFTAKADDQSRDLGDLELIPARRLVGLVDLPAGARLPPNAKIVLGRDPAWDLVELVLHPNGSFVIEGLPPETYSVSIAAKGFEIDPMRIGYQMLEYGAFGLRIADSIENLTIPLVPSGAKDDE